MDERGTTDRGTAGGGDDAAAPARGRETGDDPETDAGTESDPGVENGGSRAGRREVVVPLRLYKTVTVFSTLIAVVAVVSGFVLLDAATLEVSVLRGLVVAGLAGIGLDPAPDVLSAALAVVALAVIGFGAGVYTLGTRFRAREMGNAQEDGNEGSSNG